MGHDASDLRSKRTEGRPCGDQSWRDLSPGTEYSSDWQMISAPHIACVALSLIAFLSAPSKAAPAPNFTAVLDEFYKDSNYTGYCLIIGDESGTLLEHDR